MSISSIATAWTEQYKKDLAAGGVNDVFEMFRRSGGHMTSLEGTYNPEGSVSSFFGLSIDLACGAYNHPLVETFRTWCVEVAAAALADTQKWETKWSTVRATTHGNLVLSDCLALAWERDTAPDHGRLCDAGDELIRGLKEDWNGHWDEPEQCQFMRGVQCFLLAGEVAEAAKRFRTRKKFARTQWYHDWFQGFVAAVEAAPSSGTTPTRAQFDEFFDVIRDPRSLTSTIDARGTQIQPFHGNDQGRNISDSFPLFRLRLAILRWMYVERQPLAGNWRNVIAQISQ